MNRFCSAAALALTLTAAAPLSAALASADGNRPDPRAVESVTPGEARFDAPAAIAAVLGAGYSAVSELEWERGGWKVEFQGYAGAPRGTPRRRDHRRRCAT